MHHLLLSTLLVAVGLLASTGLAAVFLSRWNRAVLAVGSAGALGASIVGLVVAIVALSSGERVEVLVPWSLPLGSLRFGLDPLSSFFVVCVCAISGLAAFYGIGYLPGYQEPRERGRVWEPSKGSHCDRRLWPAVVGFNALEAAMLLVVLARDGVCFLLAWELMSLASFFLVTFESERDNVRRAGTTYLIASHIGVLVLLALFAFLARGAGGFAFADMAAAAALGGSTVCFVLALIGFGTKAGFWPVHFWLPDAHPAAPSHVSAVMSGVMIKMGIYGLLRVLTFLGPPPAWWGVVLVLLGAVSGIGGVLHALAQHDLKRLLAYHSVENIGIIVLGIGIGMLGQHYGNATVAALGYAGGLLHVLNHGLFKGLLFQGAGAVLHATGTRDMGALGGLLRRMPVTGATFLVGAAAISGLPPLNGFASEFLIYLGAFHAAGQLPKAAGVAALVVLPALALIGGLAAACFVKAFGVVFLGEPRTEAPRQAQEMGLAMRAPMVMGAIACAAIGLFPAAGLALAAPVARFLGGAALPSMSLLYGITWGATVLLALIALIGGLRIRLLRGRLVEQGPTWGCGYPHPTARMQYTATSFADPVLIPFASAMQVRTHGGSPKGFFPTIAHFEKHLGDMAGERVLVPVWRRFLHTAVRLRAIQHGRMQLYLVYMLVTLVALLLWQMGGALGG